MDRCDPALAAADLLGDAADIPIQALDSNRQLLCLIFISSNTERKVTITWILER